MKIKPIAQIAAIGCSISLLASYVALVHRRTQKHEPPGSSAHTNLEDPVFSSTKVMINVTARIVNPDGTPVTNDEEEKVDELPLPEVAPITLPSGLSVHPESIRQGTNFEVLEVIPPPPVPSLPRRVEAPAPAPKPKRAVMPGSKSDGGVSFRVLGVLPPPEKNRVIAPGSKSIDMLLFPVRKTPAKEQPPQTPAPKPSAQQRTVAPGSKRSGQLFAPVDYDWLFRPQAPASAPKPSPPKAP